jgi:hypothetical protein
MKSLNKLMAQIEQRSKETAERRAEVEAAEQELFPSAEVVAEAVAEAQPPAVVEPKKKKRQAGIGKKLVKAADEKLVQAEQLGLFTTFPVSDKNLIPTLIARLPIFLPTPATRQTLLLDKDLAYCFETPFGKGRRFGPPVTIEDEDVLYAMLQLSERRLIGKGSKLPVPLNDADWLRDDNNDLTVQVMIATVGQINQEIGLSRAGNNYKNTLAAIKRLGQVGIEIETRKSEMYLGKSWTGETIRLVDLKWRAYNEEGLIFAQFSPIMVKWLREQATYYNWKIRRELKSANGKALHRFLSTQGNHYRKEIEYIADVIGWYGDRNRLRPRMEQVMKQLRDKHDWCTYEITGTGRANPFVLEFWRTRKSS